jgi:hypothetical protein
MIEEAYPEIIAVPPSDMGVPNLQDSRLEETRVPQSQPQSVPSMFIPSVHAGAFVPLPYVGEFQDTNPTNSPRQSSPSFFLQNAVPQSPLKSNSSFPARSPRHQMKSYQKTSQSDIMQFFDRKQYSPALNAMEPKTPLSKSNNQSPLSLSKSNNQSPLSLSKSKNHSASPFSGRKSQPPSPISKTRNANTPEFRKRITSEIIHIGKENQKQPRIVQCFSKGQHTKALKQCLSNRNGSLSLTAEKISEMMQSNSSVQNKKPRVVGVTAGAAEPLIIYKFNQGVYVTQDKYLQV